MKPFPRSMLKHGIACILLFQFLVSCAVNPVTGKRELNLLSERREIQLGAEADPAIIAQYGLYKDDRIAKFVDDLGQKMARISHRPTLAFHFRVLDSPVINAFALPGGYVYITRGILGYINSEAELAGIMGHEIGHVTARHGAKAYTRAQIAQVGFAAGYILSPTFRQFGDLASQSIGLLFLKFSRDQERQADELGVLYSTKIGFDATNMSHFFGTLSRLRSESGQSLPDWQATHPNPNEREAKTLALTKQDQAKFPRKKFRTDRAPYLKLIDGIVYGEDPRQGFVENGYFYHPTLDFQFPVPQGWQVVNTPQQVQLVNEKQNAGIQFSLADEATARAAAAAFISKSKAKVLKSDVKRFHGFPTEIRESTVTTQQGELKILSYFIQKGKQVYVFHGFGSPANYNKNLSSFKYTMGNFNRLKNQKARHVKPTRVKIVRVTKRTTLKRFLSKYPNKKVPPEKLAIINGMQLTDKVKPGDQIKVLKKF